MPRPLALVTGASSGIGVDLARELARDGHDVVLTARSAAPMEALAAELKSLGASATIIVADLSQPGAAAALAREIEARGLAIESVDQQRRSRRERPLSTNRIRERVSEMLQVNIVALTELTRALLPAMVARRRGRVMLVASTAAFQPGPQMAVY
jgi:short-subunit dehydrogenase